MSSVIYSLAITLLDLQIGSSKLIEISNEDQSIVLDNFHNLIIIYKPKELLVFGENNLFLIDNFCIIPFCTDRLMRSYSFK